MIVSSEACPQCRYDKSPFGPELHYPYIKHLTHKEVDKSFMYKMATNSAMKLIEEIKPNGKTLKVMAFIDDKYMDYLQLAKALVVNEEASASDCAVDTEEYLKLLTLFDGFSGDQVV